MDWLEASKVSYYKNDEVPKIIDDINQRTNSQMRCCRRELVCLFYDFIWNSPSCYWDNNVCTQFSGRLTAIASQHPDIIISESMIEHFLSACSTYSQITSIINDLDSINENDSIKNRLYRIPTYTSIVEGCLTNLFRFTVLLIEQFSVQDYSAQRKLEPLRTVLIKNGFSNGIESVDVKIRNSINHGGVIFREDGRVIEFHYMENSKSLSKELTVYEFDDLINRMYDITSAALLSVCLFLNEHWDKISVNMSQKTFVSFALLSMKLSIPSIRCRFISDTSNSKQLNADFYTVKTDRAFIVETALKISLMIYSVYPDYDQYYLSFSSERLQKSWIRFTNSELAYATATGDFAGIVKSAANRGDIIVFAPSIENVDLHEIKYFRFPNYVSDKFIINKIEDASLEDRKRLKCHLFIGDTQDKQEILKIIKDAIGWLNTLKNMDSPTIHRKNGSMEADALYINVYKHDIRHSKALHPANENFVCFVDYNKSGTTTLVHGDIFQRSWNQLYHEKTGLLSIAWREKKYAIRRIVKISANAPCPCGSGKKFKKCCRGKNIYD